VLVSNAASIFADKQEMPNHQQAYLTEEADSSTEVDAGDEIVELVDVLAGIKNPEHSITPSRSERRCAPKKLVLSPFSFYFVTYALRIANPQHFNPSSVVAENPQPSLAILSRVLRI
jgi:hypothetical protein